MSFRMQVSPHVTFPSACRFLVINVLMCCNKKRSLCITNYRDSFYLCVNYVYTVSNDAPWNKSGRDNSAASIPYFVYALSISS